MAGLATSRASLLHMSRSRLHGHLSPSAIDGGQILCPVLPQSVLRPPGKTASADLYPSSSFTHRIASSRGDSPPQQWTAIATRVILHHYTCDLMGRQWPSSHSPPARLWFSVRTWLWFSSTVCKKAQRCAKLNVNRNHKAQARRLRARVSVYCDTLPFELLRRNGASVRARTAVRV